MSTHRTPDLLDLAEAVAGGRMSRADADSAIRAQGGRDTDDRLAELDSLVLAVVAVERHAEARRRASAGVGGAVDRGSGDARWPGTGVGGDARGPAVGPVRTPTVRATRGLRGALAGLAVGGVAVIVVGAVLVGALRVPSSAGPLPTPATLVTADPAIPPIVDTRLEGAPRAAFWSLVSPDRVAVWTWRSGEALAKLAEADAWADPAGTPPGGLGSVQRTLLVSPDGRRFAFAETTGSGILRGRFRVFDAGGRLVWELGGTGGGAAGGTGADGVESTAVLAFAWARDGRTLAVESGSWDVVTFVDGGAATSRHLDATTPGENAYGLIGFSADGSRLYGWETGGEAEWWQRPVSLDLASGALTTLAEFPADALTGVGASSATFPLERIAGGSGAALVQPLLAKGDAAWAAVRGGVSVPVATSTRPEDADPRWGAGGRVIVVTPRAAAESHSIPAGTVLPETAPAGAVSIVVPGATGTPRDAFVFAPGAYDVAAGGVSGDYVVCLVAAPHGAIGGPALGYDEAVLIRIPDGATSVGVAPGRSADGAGLAFAGWLPAL